jgi:hypothetical protein
MRARPIVFCLAQSHRRICPSCGGRDKWRFRKEPLGAVPIRAVIPRPNGHSHLQIRTGRVHDPTSQPLAPRSSGAFFEDKRVSPDRGETVGARGQRLSQGDHGCVPSPAQARAGSMPLSTLAVGGLWYSLTKSVPALLRQPLNGEAAEFRELVAKRQKVFEGR